MTIETIERDLREFINSKEHDGRWADWMDRVDGVLADLRAYLAASPPGADNAQVAPAEPAEGKATCERCGGPALTWFAPNPLWNRIQGGPGATDDPGGMLCPNCFIRKAEAAGVVPTAWVIDRENLADASDATAPVTVSAKTEHISGDVLSEAATREAVARRVERLETALRKIVDYDPGRSDFSATTDRAAFAIETARQALGDRS